MAGVEGEKVAEMAHKGTLSSKDGLVIINTALNNQHVVQANLETALHLVLKFQELFLIHSVDRKLG